MSSEIEFNTAGSLYSTASTAEWKRTQEHTFTRWVNQHLAKANKSVHSLRTDLADGLTLIALLEVLSGKKLPKHQARPVLRSQKMDNVSLALRFLEESEGIRVVNIDVADIVDCKLKLILGLIWHLILHYSISKPNPVNNHDDHSGESNCNVENSLTAHRRLLAWLQARMPAVALSNFRTDWNDGRYLGYLINSFDPTLCSDWYTWNPRNAKDNVRRAMDAAEEHLGIAQLVDAEDVASRDLDEPSMMTYLAQFRNAKVVLLKTTKQPPTEPPPPPPSTPTPSYKEDKENDYAKTMTTAKFKGKCNAFGEGLVFGRTGEQNRFMVDTRPAAAAAATTSRRQRQGYDGGPAVRLGLSVEGPSETQLMCTDNHDGFWTIDYKPEEPGEYMISVKLNDEHVEGSPFKVFVGTPTPVAVAADNNSGAVTNCNCKQCQSMSVKSKLGRDGDDKAHAEKGRKKSRESSGGGGHKGQPFRVSILGRNSPQYVVDKADKNNNGHKHSTTQTQTVTFVEEKANPSTYKYQATSRDGKTGDTKPAPGSVTHEVSVTTTIDSGNRKTKSKVTHKDAHGQREKQAQGTKLSPSGAQDPTTNANTRQYPPIPKEWLPRAPPESADWNIGIGHQQQYPPIPREWLRRGGEHEHGAGVTGSPNANAESTYWHRHEDDEYHMEIYTNQPRHKNKVVVHSCPCKECQARRSRSKVVIWTNDGGADEDDDGYGGNRQVKTQHNDRDHEQPYRETIISSTIEIHNPQDSCHIM